MSILIENVAILPMTGDPVIESGEIAIEAGRLRAVGAAPRDFQPETVIDGRNCVATPGLINCHTHAAMCLFRGYADDLPLMEWLHDKIWPVEDELTAEDVYWGTLLAGLEMIRSGTTTFADQYFHMDQVARAVTECGLRACLSRGLIGAAPNGEEALEWSRGFARDYHGAADGRITVMLGPHAPYTCPPEYLGRVAEAARELNVGIHIHLAETRTEIKQIEEEYGCTPVEMAAQNGLFTMPVLAAHCVYVTESDISLLAKHGVGVVHNPQSNMKLGSGIAPVTALRAAGVTVALGTDGAASNNDLDMVDEMRSAALLQKVAREDPTVLPAGQALRMATADGAAALGLADETGTLETGKKADLVLWDLEKPHLYPRHNIAAHLVYSARGSDARTVIVDGKILMRDYEVLVVDEEKVLAEAQRRARRMVAAIS